MPARLVYPTSQGGRVYLWEMTESVGELLSQLSLSSELQQMFQSITAPHRQREWLTSKLIVSQYLGDSVTYGGTRIPKLASLRHSISISHTSSLCAVFVSDSACGVDVESVDRDFGRVAKRFLSSEELGFITTNRLQCIAWCAKESLYKALGRYDIEFNRDFIIKQIAESSLRMEYENNIYHLDFFEFEDTIVCYTC